jgi:murein DD-endopeptidase MepM/ murein hydrolase activator NlpD
VLGGAIPIGKYLKKRGATLLTGKRLFKTIAAAVLSLTVIFTASVGAAPATASSLSDLQQQQSALKQKQNEIDSQLTKLKNNKAQQQQYKDALDAKIKNVEQQIDNKNIQITALDADILKKQNEIAGKQKEIDANFQKLKERVYALYLTGEASNLEIVLNAKNIMDLADKTELMQVIAEHDTGLINTLKSDMNSVKVQKAAIESSRKTVSDRKTELDQNRQQLTSLSAEATKVIAALGQSQKQAEAEKAKNAAAEKAGESAIDQWYANYYASQKNNNNSDNNASHDNSGPKGSGSFQWPVPSYICISQGYGSYDMGSFHKGIDIAASYGSRIVAADGGTVIWAGYQEHGQYGGYGNVVVIDHGNGCTSLYAHMSSIAVGGGQHVSKGDVIGYIGSTGDSTGNHCHFEIRHYGSPTNPMSYFG